MPSKTASLAAKFVKHAKALETTRAKMENLVSVGRIGNLDIEQVYAGLFLNIFTEFEALLEDLFFGLLMGKLYSAANPIRRKVRISPAEMCEEIVFAEKNYLDWLPFDDHTLPRAKRFFHNGEPFNLLNPTQVSNLKEYHLIRNAGAHKSKIARKRFNNIIRQLTLLPQERTPTGYLRSKPSAITNQTQYEIAVLELENIARRLCA